MADLSTEELERLRRAGRNRRPLSAAQQRRAELNALGVIETGLLTDNEVLQALAAFRTGESEREVLR